MTLWIDEKYINLISPQLDRFKWNKSGEANFRCPLCGDSKKSKLKMRGYLYHYGDTYLMKCHNCQASLSFQSFLNTLDPILYKNYIFDVFKFNNDYRWHEKKSIDREESVRKKIKEYTTTDLRRVSDLSDNHKCVQFVKKRNIPKTKWKHLFYTSNFKKWINVNISPEKFENDKYPDQRLVIPFYDMDGKIFAYQGRAIYECDPAYRYITINESDNLLIYGLERVQTDKPIYVVEGPIDSLFIDNALAVAGSALSKFKNISGNNFIFAFDNEPRSKIICKLMNEMITLHKPIVIYPNSIDKKDINDMVLGGIDVDKLLKDNTFIGNKAKLKFNQWKKI